MPQMMPMLWMILFLMFLLFFILLISKMYFFFLPKLNNINYMKISLNYWIWMW